MRKKTGSVIIIPLVAAAALLAQSCSKDEHGKAVQDQAPVSAVATAEVTLVPEAPKAGTMLRALVSGEGVQVRWLRNGQPLANEGDTLSTTGFRKGDVIRAVAGPEGSQSAAEAVLVNAPPVIRSVTILPRPFYKGQDISAETAGWDPDGDNISYRYEWTVNGERVYEADGQALPGGSYSRGDLVAVRIVPYDGENEGESFNVEAGRAGNLPPRFTSSPPADFSGRFLYTPAVSDPDGDSVTLLLERSPEGMAIANGTIEWRAKEEQKGSFEVTVAAEDGFGGKALQTFELKVGQ
jgi:hypothetical protein